MHKSSILAINCHTASTDWFIRYKYYKIMKSRKQFLSLKVWSFNHPTTLFNFQQQTALFCLSKSVIETVVNFTVYMNYTQTTFSCRCWRTWHSMCGFRIRPDFFRNICNLSISYLSLFYGSCLAWQCLTIRFGCVFTYNKNQAGKFINIIQWT